MEDLQRRLNAIRRLSRKSPMTHAKERLEQIAAIASGSGDLDSVFRSPNQTNLAERLAAGQASRSPMPGDKKKEEAAKERKAEKGRDRKERSGRDREGVDTDA